MCFAIFYHFNTSKVSIKLIFLNQCKWGTNSNSFISTSLTYINNATISRYLMYQSLWYMWIIQYAKPLGSLTQVRKPMLDTWIWRHEDAWHVLLTSSYYFSNCCFFLVQSRHAFVAVRLSKSKGRPIMTALETEILSSSLSAYT